MNAEHPIYKPRSFYGPLNLAADIPQNGDRYIMTHPDDPSKLVRASGKGVYYDPEEMHSRVHIAQQVLLGLGKHGVNYVNPSYIDETSDIRTPHLITVVDKLDNCQPYVDLLANEKLTTDHVYEADQAIRGMFSYIEQAMRENGPIDPEMMRLDQFMYDSSQPEGKRIILVDIEPTSGSEIDMSEDSMKYGYPSTLLSTVVRLCVDAIELSNKAGYSIASLEKAAQVIEQLPGDSPATHAAQAELLQALDSGKISAKMMKDLVNGGLWDDYDE